MEVFKAVLISLDDIVAIMKGKQDFEMISHLLRSIVTQYDTASYYRATVAPLPKG